MARKKLSGSVIIAKVDQQILSSLIKVHEQDVEGTKITLLAGAVGAQIFAMIDDDPEKVYTVPSSEIVKTMMVAVIREKMRGEAHENARRN